jgi:hypothetical protein
MPGRQEPVEQNPIDTLIDELTEKLPDPELHEDLIPVETTFKPGLLERF